MGAITPACERPPGNMTAAETAAMAMTHKHFRMISSSHLTAQEGTRTPTQSFKPQTVRV